MPYTKVEQASMKPLQELTERELQQEARRAIAGHTQAEAAQALEVTPSAISLALNTATPKRYASTLIRMIEHFTSHRVQAVTLYRVLEEGKVKKGGEVEQT